MTTLEVATTAAVAGVVAGASFAVGKAVGDFAAECASRALASPAQAALRACDKANLMMSGTFDEMATLTAEEQQKVMMYILGSKSITELPVALSPVSGLAGLSAA